MDQTTWTITQLMVATRQRRTIPVQKVKEAEAAVLIVAMERAVRIVVMERVVVAVQPLQKAKEEEDPMVVDRRRMMRAVIQREKEEEDEAPRHQRVRVAAARPAAKARVADPLLPKVRVCVWNARE
jgi:hypothetical protein